MRTRDEVLREFGISAAQFAGDYELKMADHIVAVEHQRDNYHAMWKQETLAKRKLADRIRALEERVATADAEREQAFQVAQQNEATARNLKARLDHVERVAAMAWDELSRAALTEALERHA